MEPAQKLMLWGGTCICRGSNSAGQRHGRTRQGNCLYLQQGTEKETTHPPPQNKNPPHHHNPPPIRPNPKPTHRPPNPPLRQPAPPQHPRPQVTVKKNRCRAGDVLQAYSRKIKVRPRDLRKRRRLKKKRPRKAGW